LVFPLQKEHRTKDAAISSQNPDHASEALAQYSMGVLESSAGNDDEALARYEAALKNDPGNTELMMEMAIGYFQRNRFDEMDALLDAVLKVDPRQIRALQLKALGLRVRGRHEEALVPLNAAIQIEPAEAIHYLEVASIRARTGGESAAVSELEHALTKVTDRLSIFQALGELYLRQASEMLQQNKKARLPKTTLEVMETAVEEFPEDPYLLTQYGDLLILHRRMEDAIDIFARIEALNPADLQIRQKLAMNLVAVGDRAGAISLLEGIAEKRPDNARVRYYLAELYEQDGNPEKALERYQQVIDLNPNQPEAYLKKAYVYLGRNENNKALDVLINGQHVAPHDGRIVEMLAYVYISTMDYTNALPAFVEAEKQILEAGKKPLFSNFYLNYAIAQQMCTNTDEASRLLRVGHESNPSIIDDYLILVFRERDDVEKLTRSLKVLEPLQDIVPEDSSTYTVYGLIAFHAGEHAAALSLLERAESLSRQTETDEELTAQFYFWLGASAERVKEYEKAEQYFLSAITKQPDHADAHNYLAYMLAERGVKLDMAADHVGVALAVEPDNAAFLDTRGWIYFQQGNYTAAMEDIKMAADKIPDDPTIADHLGDIYLALGDVSQAIIWWEKSLTNDPEGKTVAAKLEQHRVKASQPPVEIVDTNSALMSVTNEAPAAE
jgi:tetratricopeptide (TPR) repeat protein